MCFPFRRWIESSGHCDGREPRVVGPAGPAGAGGTFTTALRKVWCGSMPRRSTEVRLSPTQFTLSKCLDAVLVMGNSHMAMARTNRLAVIASHFQDRLAGLFSVLTGCIHEWACPTDSSCFVDVFMYSPLTPPLHFQSLFVSLQELDRRGWCLWWNYGWGAPLWRRQIWTPVCCQ